MQILKPVGDTFKELRKRQICFDIFWENNFLPDIIDVKAILCKQVSFVRHLHRFKVCFKFIQLKWPH